jgi:hypothetical protein
MPSVLLVEHDANRLVSIANSLSAVVQRIMNLAHTIFDSQDSRLRIKGSPPVESEYDVSWFHAYEFRIRDAHHFRDPAIMRIDVGSGYWVTIDAPTSHALHPFCAAFREPPLIRY